MRVNHCVSIDYWCIENETESILVVVNRIIAEDLMRPQPTRLINPAPSLLAPRLR